MTKSINDSRMDDREYALLDALYHGREREVRHIRDELTLRALFAKNWVLFRPGRLRPVRSSADITRMVKQGQTSGMVTQEEAHLTTSGLRAYRKEWKARQSRSRNDYY